jgi:glycosyltransferase involved in cell wall biosynthesis
MRILHTVEFFYPSIGGAQEVVRQISERLVGLGHEVTVATSKLPDRSFSQHNGVRIVEFDIKGSAVHGYSGPDVDKYKRFLTNSKFDIMMNYAAQQWATDLAFEVLDTIQAAKVLIPCGFSGLKLPEYREYFKEMPKILKKYDATIYNGDEYQDIKFAKAHKLKNLRIIPNGAGADEFEKDYGIDIRRQLRIPKDNFLILSVGSHTGMKGHIEAIKIFERADIANATLLIVGNDFGKGCAKQCNKKAAISKWLPRYIKSRKQLLVKDLNRPSTVAAYQAADIFLFPSNIEASPIVLFESAASKTPFLVTDVGNAAEIIKWTGGGILLPTSKDKAGYSHVDIGKAVKLLEDLYHRPRQLDDMASSGYSSWREKYSWEVIAGQFLELYSKLLEGKTK